MMLTGFFIGFFIGGFFGICLMCIFSINIHERNKPDIKEGL